MAALARGDILAGSFSAGEDEDIWVAVLEVADQDICAVVSGLGNLQKGLRGWPYRDRSPLA